MGGPDVPSNRSPVCDTGHRNVHVYLVWLIFGKNMADGSDVEPKLTRSEKQMAMDGYARWKAAGEPGDPHAAYAIVIH
jgi:hypothetical protein